MPVKGRHIADSVTK